MTKLILLTPFICFFTGFLIVGLIDTIKERKTNANKN